MSKIISMSPAVLLRKSDNSAVTEGEQITIAPGHLARVTDLTPDSSGKVTVLDIYQVRPEEIGLYFQPATVTVQMTADEAAVIMPQLQQQTAPDIPAVPPLSPVVAPGAGTVLPDFPGAPAAEGS